MNELTFDNFAVLWCMEVVQDAWDFSGDLRGTICMARLMACLECYNQTCQVVQSSVYAI
jgi:hypothetical protein